METASSSSPTETVLTEEREEVMVSEKGPSLRKTHFLKPFTTSIDGGSVAELPRRHQRHSVSSSDFNRLSLRCTFSGFWFARRDFLSWFRKMKALHEPTWRKAGILEAIKASTHNITKDPSLIRSLAEKWCPKTKSFVFDWGEATITLEDVMILLGFSVLGSSVFTPLESSEMRDSVEKLEKVMLECKSTDGRVTWNSWISSFSDKNDEMQEHEAFLVWWLSYFVFPSKSRCSISKNVIPIAVRLARGERIALAPAVLANVYRDLGRIRDFARQRCNHKVNLKSLLKLVQVWTWERFTNMSPEAKEIPKGEPRISRWGSVKQKAENVRLNFDDFDWRPYTKPLKNWNPLWFYVEEALWVSVKNSLDDEFASFARCVRSSQLHGDGFVEDYYPNRVAMQFGLAQDLPALVTHEAWDNYNRSLDGLKFYMPCRLARGSVTVRYRDWWVKSVSEFLSSEETQLETFDARNTCDHRDDFDGIVSPKILPLSQIVQKLEQGFPSNLKRSRTTRRSMKNLSSVHRKRASEDDDMDEEDSDDDDNMTVAERIRYYADAEKTGRRNRRFRVVDSDDNDDEVDGNENFAEKKSNESIMESNGRRDDESKRALENDDNIEERLRKREIAIQEIALKLEQRINKEKKSLAEIRDWITKRNQTKNGVSA